jgi:hypothetical protein
VSARAKNKILVFREYSPTLDACEQAIKSLLKSNVSKAAEPATKPDGRDDVSITTGKEVGDVDHRPDK